MFLAAQIYIIAAALLHKLCNGIILNEAGLIRFPLQIHVLGRLPPDFGTIPSIVNVLSCNHNHFGVPRVNKTM